MKKLNRKQQEQNRRKLEREKEKTEFIAGMRRMIDLWGGEGSFALLPLLIVENTYRCRVLPLKPNTEHDPDLDIKSTNNLHHLVADLTRKKDFNIPVNGVNFSLSEFLTIGYTVLRVVIYCRTNAEKEPWMSDFAARFNEDTENELAGMAINFCCKLAMIISLDAYDYEKDMLWFKYELTQPHEGSIQMQHVITLYREKFEKRIFNTDAGARSALRVSFGCVNLGVLYAKVETTVLGVDHPTDEVPVYIQRHALHRLEERLDGLKRYDMQFSVFNSFEQPLVVRQHRNKVLIAYCLNNVKMGYFAAEYTQGALLIHTFLFVTNNGTPEGQKLNELTGLDKLDKKYLTIDKLSTFMHSDISSNERLKRLLIKAGCSCLLDIEKAVNTQNKNQETHAISDTILKYIDVEKRA